jgi:hypothetical protein
MDNADIEARRNAEPHMRKTLVSKDYAPPALDSASEEMIEASRREWLDWFRMCLRHEVAVGEFGAGMMEAIETLIEERVGPLEKKLGRLEKRLKKNGGT